MKRNNASIKYKWDFTNIYKNIGEWKEDSKKLLELSKEIYKLQGKLGQENNLLKLISVEEGMDEIDAKLTRYLHLSDLDKTDESLQELSTIYSNISQEVDVMTSFVVPEILSLDENNVLTTLENNNLQRYVKGYKDLFESKKHHLKKEQEELISKIEQSRSNYIDIYETLTYADVSEEKILYQEKEYILNTSTFRDVMQNSDPIKDQQFRQDYVNKYFEKYAKNKHTYAKIYESILTKDKEDYILRNYSSAINMHLESDKVSESIYTKLLKAGKTHIATLKKYFNLVKQTHGLKEMFSTDKELKLTNVDATKYSVQEGINIVKEALSLLGDEYKNNLDVAFKDNMIDYYEDVNKVSGAYSSGDYKLDPIILMNWDNQFSSLNTLAHEIGHSVHTIFSTKAQPYPLNNYPIILAEVASIFNEHILFEFMINKTKDNNEKISLIQQRVFDIVSTFYRQIQFAKFEHTAHTMIANGEPLSASKLESIYKDIENEYGYDLFDNKERKTFFWSQISHFFYSPYYVYKYAIDIVASFKLYEDFKNNKKENIISFLKLGGSLDPLDALKQVGVDFEDDNVYLPLVNEVDRLLNLLHELL
ncbi:oligoendopeptidase F [Spiroplasma corruscae]|uniref:Oligopeptidase F n=1 Tax=Spiroplasma corruscae TaxID=216934 RepID=A0A222EQD6_9MOLU|nr:oligoendopeptidase F [Spiroplasma corruscae]ASP28717.1 oligoendopeptidase F [Spiroplasma corruscae]